MENGAGPRDARFYRIWSSHAAEAALRTADARIRYRCAHSARLWTMIADALDAGDHDDVRHHTRNLSFLIPARARR